MEDERTYSAFVGDELLVSGGVRQMLLAVKERFDRGEENGVLIFEDQTGRQVDFDLRGTPEEVVERVEPPPAPHGRGRPRLGVISREVSLLPRHWDWLEQQPNGISAALRRLVEEARKREPEKERARRAAEAVSRFMTVMAGNRPGFEEATRALFAGDRARLKELIGDWPVAIREHIERLTRESPAAD